MDIYDLMKREHGEIKHCLDSIVQKTIREAILREDGVKVLSTLLRYLKDIKDDIEMNLEDEESRIFEMVEIVEEVNVR